jgi:acetyltransferase-like isoleucine patch superfamily enzyme
VTEHRTSRPSSRPALSYLLLLLDWLSARLAIFWSSIRLKAELRLLGCRYGSNLCADGRVVVRVRRSGAITLGENVKINSRFMGNLVGMTNPTVFDCVAGGEISIGDDSGCSSTVFSSQSSIGVGKNVKIGGNVRIFDHDYHPLDHLARRDSVRGPAEIESAPVVIGDDVFIGANAIILKGVHIGNRSVIGAGAVVALKNIPPDSLVAGNPARVIRSLAEATGNRAATYR